MNKDSSPASGTSSTAWILLSTLGLALAAGALALYWTMDGTSHFSAPESATQAPQANVAPGPVVRPDGTVQGAISSRLEENTPPMAYSQENPAPQTPDQAGNGEAGKDQANGGEAGAVEQTEATKDAAAIPENGAGQQAGAVLPDAAGQPGQTRETGEDKSQEEQASGQAQEQLSEVAANAAEAKAQDRPSPPQGAGQADGAGAADGSEGEGDSGTILYGKGKAVNAGHSAVRGDIPPGQKPFGRPGAPARPGRGDTIVSLAFIEDFASFLADNYWPEGSHPMARGRGFSTASAKLANMRYGMRLEGFAVNGSDPAKARRQVLAYAYMPSMLRALYGLYGDSLFQSLEKQLLDRASGPQGVYFTNAQVADFFSTQAGMARALGACAGAFRDKDGLRTQAESYARAQDEANAAYARFIDSMGDSEERQHLASAAYYEAVRQREAGARQLAIALGREGGNGLEADSRVYLALWLLRRGPENTACLSVIQEICLDGARRLDELAGRYKSLPARQIARP